MSDFGYEETELDIAVCLGLTVFLFITLCLTALVLHAKLFRSVEECGTVCDLDVHDVTHFFRAGHCLREAFEQLGNGALHERRLCDLDVFPEACINSVPVYVHAGHRVMSHELIDCEEVSHGAQATVTHACLGCAIPDASEDCVDGECRPRLLHVDCCLGVYLREDCFRVRYVKSAIACDIAYVAMSVRQCSAGVAWIACRWHRVMLAYRWM
eukprot:172772-Rhodomonas_salina.17